MLTVKLTNSRSPKIVQMSEMPLGSYGEIQDGFDVGRIVVRSNDHNIYNVLLDEPTNGWTNQCNTSVRLLEPGEKIEITI